MKPFTHLRSGLLALGMLSGLSATAMAGPAGLASGLDIAGSGALKPTSVGWNCARPDGLCMDNDTGAIRSREQIRGNDRVLEPDGGVVVRRADPAPPPPPRVADRPRFRERDRYADDDGFRRDRYAARRYDRERYDRYDRYDGYDRERYDSGVVIQFGNAPRYAEPRRIYRSNRLSSDHVNWCYDHWKSYDARSNTYSPRTGVRRECISPYS